MSRDRSAEYLQGLVNELRKLPKETEWVEFKVNSAKPEDIGEYISALANAAALKGKRSGYLVWGVENESHKVVGTSFCPAESKVGNEELENWLLRALKPRIDFQFLKLEIDGKVVVVLEIDRASQHPVQFNGQEFVRVGSYKKKLKEFPEKERELWRIFDATPFEDRIASEHVAESDVLQLLDYPRYFDLLEIPLPENRHGILRALERDGLVERCDAGGWNIRNLGALLLAKKMDEFGSLGRKSMRVIQYKGTGRIETVKEQIGTKGYAAGFEDLISFINSIVPSNEVIGKALRKTVPMYPDLAVRELVANALIHQDLFVTGAGPMVEIFSDRMEITNPGKPLMDTERFLDTPPQSRNESLASLMRRMGICEERGSGVDKVVFQTEMFQLPAPLFEVSGDSTRVVLFAHQPLAKMDKDDRVRACYLHACLKFVSRDFLTNASLRTRFGIDEKNSAMASRFIKEAVEARAIVPHDPSASRKFMKYIPFWASASAGN